MHAARMSDEPEALAAALAEHGRRFLELFPGAPPRLFFSPGRVNLMGAHLDYNGGTVMPMALDRGTFLALRPRADGRVVFVSTLEEVLRRGRRWHRWPRRRL